MNYSLWLIKLSKSQILDNILIIVSLASKMRLPCQEVPRIFLSCNSIQVLFCLRPKAEGELYQGMALFFLPLAR